jgi:hypothetical protein
MSLQPFLQWKEIDITYTECVRVALRHPACNMHAPYWYLWPVRLYSIFARYLTERYDFRGWGDLIENKMFF